MKYYIIYEKTLGEVDSQNTGQITYEQLGRVFTLLDIF